MNLELCFCSCLARPWPIPVMNLELCFCSCLAQPWPIPVMNLELCFCSCLARPWPIPVMNLAWQACSAFTCSIDRHGGRGLCFSKVGMYVFTFGLDQALYVFM